MKKEVDRAHVDLKRIDFYEERCFILLYLIISGYLWYLGGLIEFISNCADKANLI